MSTYKFSVGETVDVHYRTGTVKRGAIKSRNVSVHGNSYGVIVPFFGSTNPAYFLESEITKVSQAFKFDIGEKVLAKFSYSPAREGKVVKQERRKTGENSYGIGFPGQEYTPSFFLETELEKLPVEGEKEFWYTKVIENLDAEISAEEKKKWDADKQITALKALRTGMLSIRSKGSGL